jgi:type II secretory pathway pseudopilin PulG
MAGRNREVELAKRRRTGAFPVRRPAMTLVELLIVVSIAVLLLGVAIPLMKPALEEGRLREASRQLNTYVNLAQARAAERGRPVALWIERLENNPNAAQQVYLAESPPPYSGDIVGARAFFPAAPDTSTDPWTMTVGFDAMSATLPALAKPGDVIKFDFKGPQYPITFIGPGTITIALPRRNDPRPQNPAAGLPYQIFRQPIKSMATPLQLPGDVILDLQFSGMGWSGREFFANPSLPPPQLTQMEKNPVMIAFTPGGQVDHVAYGGMAYSATGVIHLLVGRVEKMADPISGLGVAGTLPFSATDMTATTYSENIVDPASLWISIGHRNGAVSSAENAWLRQPVGTPNLTDSLLAAREFAQSKQTMGGR